MKTGELLKKDKEFQLIDFLINESKEFKNDLKGLVSMNLLSIFLFFVYSIFIPKKIEHKFYVSQQQLNLKREKRNSNHMSTIYR